jgi:hypothetical protein
MGAAAIVRRVTATVCSLNGTMHTTLVVMRTRSKVLAMILAEQMRQRENGGSLFHRNYEGDRMIVAAINESRLCARLRGARGAQGAAVAR